jgi:hypothetical protein
MGDKHDFVDVAGGVTIDHSVFFGVETPTVSGFVSIAAVWQATGIAIITNGQDLAKVDAGDDGAYS